jgi:hypothetical protein
MQRGPSREQPRSYGRRTGCQLSTGVQFPSTAGLELPILTRWDTCHVARWSGRHVRSFRSPRAVSGQCSRSLSRCRVSEGRNDPLPSCSLRPRAVETVPPPRRKYAPSGSAGRFILGPDSRQAWRAGSRHARADTDRSDPCVSGRSGHERTVEPPTMRGAAESWAMTTREDSMRP